MAAPVPAAAKPRSETKWCASGIRRPADRPQWRRSVRRADEELRHLARLRQRMPVGCHDIKRHTLDAEFVELRGPDVGDTPELHFAGAHGDCGIDLTVDRNDFAFVAKLDVLDQKKAFRQSAQQREKLVDAVDDKRARHAAEDLIVDEAVRVRVVPEQARTLPAGRRDAHLVAECFTGLNVNKHVVAIALWRHAHAVKVQVRYGVSNRCK